MAAESALEILKYPGAVSLLIPLAKSIPRYWSDLRSHNASHCFVNEDWMINNLDSEDLRAHITYVQEIVAEEFAPGRRGSVVHTDELDCKSPFLNELKKERVTKWGSVEYLKSRIELRHLVQLDPGVRSLLHDPHREIRDWREREFSARRCSEIKALTSNRIMPEFSGDRDTRSMAHSILRYVIGDLNIDVNEGVGFLDEQDCEVSAGYLVDDGMFQLSCYLQNTGEASSSEIPNGRLTFSAFLVGRSALDTRSPIECSERIPLRLTSFLPSGFTDVGAFSSAHELGLSVYVWKQAVQLIVPDMICRLERSRLAS